MLELWVHDAWNGDEVARVVHAVDAGASWSTNLTGSGQSTWVVKAGPGDDEYSGAEVNDLFTPNARMLALRFGNVVLGAWKIEDWDYDEDAGTVTVHAVELRAETKWRMTYSLLDVQAGSLAVTNRSAQGAVRAILARFTWHPIELPADGAGTFSASWRWWEKFTIADLLAQVEDEGYEVVFRPYLTAGRQMRFETLVAPKVTSGVSFFHLQAEDRPLSGLHYLLSGVDQVTGVHGLGSGTGQDQVHVVAGNQTLLVPARDVKITFADLVGARLQAATEAARDASRLPTVQWTVDAFTFSPDFGPEHALTGREWQLESRGHPVFPDGVHGLRVIAASGSWSNQIKTEVQSAA